MTIGKKIKFKERVEYERKVLTIINSCEKLPSLNGLSLYSLEKWKSQTVFFNEFGSTENILVLLENIAADLETLSQNSTSVFQDNGNITFKKIDCYIGELLLLLSKKQ